MPSFRPKLASHGIHQVAVSVRRNQGHALRSITGTLGPIWVIEASQNLNVADGSALLIDEKNRERRPLGPCGLLFTDHDLTPRRAPRRCNTLRAYDPPARDPSDTTCLPPPIALLIRLSYAVWNT